MLRRAHREGCALGAFNVFGILAANAVTDAADDMKLPVIIQTSVPVVQRYTPRKLGALLKEVGRRCSREVAIHLDHCRDPQLAMQCIDCGWDAVMLDGSHLPFEENIAVTKAVADYAHAKGRGAEGELGAILGVEDDICSDIGGLVDFEHSMEFIGRTGIDAYAPAIGTAHGQYSAAPQINYPLVRELAAKAGVPIVIHGGSGLSDDSFRELVACGAAKINISTALKMGYVSALERIFAAEPPQNPLVIDTMVEEELSAIVRRHMELFSGRGKEAGERVPS